MQALSIFRVAGALLLALPLGVLSVPSVAQAPAGDRDVIEFLSGARIEGKVAKIDKENKVVIFDAVIAGRTLSREYPYAKLHAVTYMGKRYVLNEKGAAPSDPAPTGTAETVAAGANRGVRPASEINALIAQAGKTPPDWYDATPLEHPPTLDLTWPEKPPGGWNNQKNVGQYLWDVVNPNPGRWRSGVRLMHHLLAMHKDDPEKRLRVMRTLGGMYFNLFQDYPRAAFWWQQAGTLPNDHNGVSLAECYYRLGNRQMAEPFLMDPDKLRGNKLQLEAGMVKLWGDMGETEKAVKLAELYVRSGGEAFLPYLFAGDALRREGRYKEALTYYERVVKLPPGANPNRNDRNRKRAQASLDAIKLFELSDVSRVADGSYRAASLGYEGPVEVEVSVAGGKITDCKVTRHTEKQFYSSIADVPAQIIQKQNVKGIDATSRATITGDAIINAAAKALASGAK